MKPQDFTATFGPLAEDIGKETGLSPQTVLGIVAQETGWGDHFVGNNIFGISPSRDGKQYVAQYPSIQAAGKAFVDLVKSRYSDASKGATPEDQARMIAARGYNPSQAYGGLVAQRIATMKGSGSQATAPAASDDDLLARTRSVAPQPATAAPATEGATAAPGAAEASSDDLLARTRQVAPGPKAAAAPVAEPRVATGMDEYGRTVDQHGLPMSDSALGPGPAAATKIVTGSPPGAAAPTDQPKPDTTTPLDEFGAPVGRVMPEQAPANRIIDAGVQGFKGTEPILTPKGTEAVSNWAPGGVRLGDYVVNPLLKVADAGRGAANALMGAGTQGVMEATSPVAVGPEGGQDAGSGWGARLGRDINQMLQVAPVAHVNAGMPTVRLPELNENALRERSGAAANPLATPAPDFIPPGTPAPPAAPVPAPEPPAFVPPGAVREPPAASSPGMGGPQPQSAGAAATPSGLVGVSPKEEAAYRATAEGNKWLERQQIGQPDRNAYVPDVTPNAAEQEQTVTMARELKSLGVSSTEASQAAKEAAVANNEARERYLQSIIKSPVDVNNAKAARAAQAEADLKATWANKTDADASPVVELADMLKQSPDGRRPAVRNAIDSVTSEMKDADGNLYTDPEQLYGVRKHIDDLLSKEGQRQTPMSARATASLQVMKERLDSVIENAAPGFKQYLSNFSDASRGIDEMEVLQGHEKGLYDAQGRITYNKVQTMMRNIVDSRASQGLNPYKSLSDDTMAQLWNLRDDLRRSASALELARAQGSDTTANVVDLVKQYSRLGGTAGAHAIANAVSPGFGSIALRALSAGTAPIRSGLVARRQARRAQELLNPSNPLVQPPAGYNNPLTGPPP